MILETERNPIHHLDCYRDGKTMRYLLRDSNPRLCKVLATGKRSTHSSVSGLKFGHCKAVSVSKMLGQMLC